MKLTFASDLLHFGRKRGPGLLTQCCHYSNSRIRFQTSPATVFDSNLKTRQRTWTYCRNDDYYDYLREEAASRICDRIDDISRSFPLALELGSYRSHVYNVINNRENLRGDTGGVGGIEMLYQCDTLPEEIVRANFASSQNLNENPIIVQTEYFQVDNEMLPFKEHSFDMVLSSLSLHWVNDLTSTFAQIKSSLKPDGVFIGAMLGGSTLEELKYCLYLAELERRGGTAPHVSPFILPSDVAALMQSAGFALPTVDIDTITISYPDAFSLMEHLQYMGENNCDLRRNFHVGKDTLLAAAAIYKELFGLEDGSISATFQIIYVIGWAPDESQPKPCKRGTGRKSMKELGNSSN